jgi:CBS domain-containing protein
VKDEQTNLWELKTRSLDMKVRDLMTGNVQSCRPETNLSSAAAIMWDADCGVLPVVDEDSRVFGLITDRDIAMAAATRGRHPSEIAVREVISGHVCAVSPDEDIQSALKAMRQSKVRRLPVTDNDGILQGILSLNDIVLRAEEARTSDITYEEVMNTYKAICEHRPRQAAAQV